MRVLIAPDKFKGTLTAKAAARAIAEGWRRARPLDSVEVLPMSDGGDGFGEVMSGLLGAMSQTVNTCDAAHRRCRARWWWHAQTRTAIIDTARVIGLAMLPLRRYHPFELDTYGLGKVLRATSDKGASRILVGIGGSATNDGGFGMARALGWEVRDNQGKRIERWTELERACEITHVGQLLGKAKLIVAVDVQNPLLGAQGASRVYGPQKGLKPKDFPRAEGCLRRLASVLSQSQGTDLRRAPGAGAAGGLGFGFASFLGAQLVPGFELFAREVNLQERLRRVDLVITGEGAVDGSTFMGKGTGQIAKRCRALGIPCVCLAGVIDSSAMPKRLLNRTHALTELVTLEQAKAEPELWLGRLAYDVASGWPKEKPNAC